jgi:hypothetical protein
VSILDYYRKVNNVYFQQYLAANMNKLPFTGEAAGTITLHGAYKAVYTGVDRDGPREVLQQLPGVAKK